MEHEGGRDCPNLAEHGNGGDSGENASDDEEERRWEVIERVQNGRQINPSRSVSKSIVMHCSEALNTLHSKALSCIC